MKNVFLFPGQGTQKKGMLKDVCEKFPEAMEVVKKVEQISGQPVTQFMWETEDSELSRSDKSQLAITAASLALIQVLKNKGIEPDLCAGFSLGEYSALYGAGVLSFEDTVKVVTQRGIIMQQVCDELAAESNGKQPGMAAVLGLKPDQVIKAIEPLTAEGICFAANLNSIKQTVISGTAEGLEKAEGLCKEAGCRKFVVLKVTGPFHSPLMAKAGERFAKVLDEVDFRNPSKRLFSNVTGKEIVDGKEAKELAVKHFTNSVCWIDEEAEIAKIIDFENSECAHNWNILEVGPGTVLSGLWRDSGYAENINCSAVNSVETLD